MNDVDLILRLPKPAPMIVESDFAAMLFGFDGDGLDAIRLRHHAGIVGLARLQQVPAAHDPELGG